MTTMQARRIGWGAAAGLLSLPLIAMPFTREVNWTPSDFAAFAALLLAGGGAIDLAARAKWPGATRTLAIAAVVAAFLLLWAELAIGLFDGYGRVYPSVPRLTIMFRPI